MSIIIGSARHDENGKYTGGKAGDQKQVINKDGYDMSGEVSTQEFYVHSKGWNIFRAKNPNVANGIAFSMALACINNNIGYSQSGTDNRYGIIKNGILSKVPTNCDCTSLGRQCIRNTGIEVGDFTTTTAESVLLATGQFEKVKFTSKEDLYNGDILCTKTKGHMAIVVSGAKQRVNNTEKCPYPEPSATLRKGDKGDEIKWLQWQLNRHGANLVIDGVFGSKTLSAVRAYQKAHSLTVDGIVGNITRNSLKKN